jgi:hypothetical protein
MEGWFKLYRSVLEHRHYRKKRVFNEYEAWLDILLLANYTDKTIDIEGQQVLVKRGTFLTSQKKLADRWDWDKRKVVSFLKDSELHKEITVLTEKRWTVVTVLNYEKYQGKTLEIEIKSVPTFAPTFAPTSCTDFIPENTGENDISCTDFTHRLTHRSMYTTKEYIKNNKEKDIVSEVVSFLNEKAGTKYKTTVQKTKAQILARVKEGFVLDDFFSVIIAKVSEWSNDTKMSKFIRPETLFGTKFESYLQTARKAEQKVSNNAPPLYTPTKEELEHYARLHRTE